MNVTVHIDKGNDTAVWLPDAHAWRLIDEWCTRTGHTRQHTLAVVIKLGLASLHQAMGKEDAEAARVS